MARILIVDDNSDWREKLRAWLIPTGHDVEIAADEGDAMACLAQTQFQLALIDVRLHSNSRKDESGLSLALAMRNLDPHVRVILLTAFVPGTEQVVRAVRYQGVMNFVEKRSLGDASSLNELVQRVLAAPDYDESESSCQIGLSLEIGQTLVVRTRGTYVVSIRTPEVLEIDLPRYLRRAEMARVDPIGFRFSIKGIGQDLYRDIFLSHRKAHEVYLSARARSNLVSLGFEASREFLGVPLELLRSSETANPNYLSLLHPMSRIVNGVAPQNRALSPQVVSRFKGKLRVLVITSDTHPPISLVDQMGEEIKHLLQESSSIEVKLVSTSRATYSAVRDELRQCPYHIVHYVGHGLFEENSPEQSSLFLWEGENRSGNIMAMSGAELSFLLRDSNVRLFHLTCCEGTRTGTSVDLLDDDYLGIADGIIQAGVPSVLGFRWPVTVGGARRLALDFYRSLLKHGSPERALWNARSELFAVDPDSPDWASPILIVQS